MTAATMAHTPGPWRVAEPGGQGNPAVYALDGVSIANVGGTVPTRDPEITARRRANARLIAVAPEMYEALEALTDLAAQQLTFHRVPEGGAWTVDDEAAAQIVERGRTVLAKATGGEV